MLKMTRILIVLLLALMLAGCTLNSDQSKIVMYDGTFSEMKIINQMVKMLVEEHTDARIDLRAEMDEVNTYKEMVAGSADILNTYDGTLLTTYLKLDTSDVPEEMTIYDYSNQVAFQQAGVHMLDKLGSENTYAVGVLPQTAEKYNLKTISDLATVAEQLVFGAEHGFYSEEGSMKYKPFVQFYNLNFKENKPLDMALKYSAVESGNIDATIVYTTDGLNKKSGLVILEDDKEFFPEYNDALLVRNDLFERFSESAPNLEDVLNRLGGQFTNELMTDLTYEVDVNGRTPEDVAREFLVSRGLIK